MSNKLDYCTKKTFADYLRDPEKIGDAFWDQRCLVKDSITFSLREMYSQCGGKVMTHLAARLAKKEDANTRAARQAVRPWGPTKRYKTRAGYKRHWCKENEYAYGRLAVERRFDTLYPPPEKGNNNLISINEACYSTYKQLMSKMRGATMLIFTDHVNKLWDLNDETLRRAMLIKAFFSNAVFGRWCEEAGLPIAPGPLCYNPLHSSHVMTWSMVVGHKEDKAPLTEKRVYYETLEDAMNKKAAGYPLAQFNENMEEEWKL